MTMPKRRRPLNRPVLPVPILRRQDWHDDPLDDADIDNSNAAGDDRSEFNLGAGSRWVRPTPTDDATADED